MKKICAILLVLAVFASGAVFFLKTAYVVPVLMYHSIGSDVGSQKLSVSPKSFERQMEFLYYFKYNVVSLDKIADYLKKKKPMPPRTIAITFDDGYRDNYQYAYPVLKRYGIPATIFVITDKIGMPGYLNWDELKEMSSSGLVTIGSHTVSHKWLPSLGTATLQDELTRSRNILEEGLGVEVRSLCYPVGAHNERVEREAASSGYACAVATNPGVLSPSDDIYSIKRIRISGTSDNILVFWFETSGYYTWVKERREN